MKRLTIILLAGCCVLAAGKKKKEPVPSALDRYITESEARSGAAAAASPGSTYVAGSRLADFARDVRASQVDDVLTIIVAESASAVSTGATKTGRSTSTKNSISALGGLTNAAGPLSNLANISGDTQLNGQGSTSRSTSLNTVLTARVTHVLPNGALVIESSKDIQINAEQQTITVRGVIRPDDIDFTNSVQSTRLAQLEIRVNGKGVVGDAIRRPNILWRILLGILPF
jgi:flagellar L-ring protein precursor FlgH